MLYTVAPQEVTVLRRKLDALQIDNENLLTAVKFLKAKVEGPASRSATPSGEIMAGISSSGCSAQATAMLYDQLAEVERENDDLRRRLVELGEGGKHTELLDYAMPVQSSSYAGVISTCCSRM